MKKKWIAAAAVVSAGLMTAGVAPANAMTGAKCTESHAGNSNISTTIVNNTTKVICIGGGTDTVTITAAPATASSTTRFVIVKGQGVLNVVWSAGPAIIGEDNGLTVQGEFTIIRPASNVVVNASNGASPNSNSTGTTVGCGTNAAYAQQSTIIDFATGTIDWRRSLGTNTVANFCVV